LAVGLAMDAAAVAVVRGTLTPVLRLRHFLLVGLYFGGFQALMPLAGYWAGAQAGDRFAAWDHWIAFVLLGVIGAKMIHEGVSGELQPVATAGDPFTPRTMLPLALATSIDALAAGATLPMLGAPLVLSITTIGIVTALLAAAGLALGRRFGAMLGRRFDAVGGVVLVLLGTKILIQHLTA